MTEDILKKNDFYFNNYFWELIWIQSQNEQKP